MKKAVAAYAAWLFGIASAVALAWAYHRRLSRVASTGVDPDVENPVVEPPAAVRPRGPLAGDGDPED